MGPSAAYRQAAGTAALAGAALAQRVELLLPTRPIIGEHAHSPARACTTCVCVPTRALDEVCRDSTCGLCQMQSSHAVTLMLLTSQGALWLPCKAAQQGWQTPQGGKACLVGHCQPRGNLLIFRPVGSCDERLVPPSTKAQQRAGEQCRQGSPVDLLSPISAPHFIFCEGCQGRRTQCWER